MTAPLRRARTIARVRCRFVFVVVAGAVALAGCQATPPAPSPTPNIEGTVQARVQATQRALPTATSVPTLAPTPTVVPTATAMALGVPVGSEGYLWSGVGKDKIGLAIAADEAAVADYVKVLRAGDTIGLVELAARYRITNVREATKVLVLEEGCCDLVRVRLMSGAKAPSSGWIFAKWVVASLPDSVEPVP